MDGTDHTLETTTLHSATIEIRLSRPFADADCTAVREIIQLIMVESVVGPSVL